MPYPSQINHKSILEAARQIIEAEGLEGLSLRVLAEDHLGVKAPSLYRYFRNKKALLLAVAEETIKGLFDVLYEAMRVRGSLNERVLAVARAYRQYAHDNPVTYQLVFINTDPELQLSNDMLVPMVSPMQDLFREICGEEQSLPALRGMLAMVHGWTMLELANQLRRGGDLNTHYEQVIRAYVTGLRQTA